MARRSWSLVLSVSLVAAGCSRSGGRLCAEVGWTVARGVDARASTDGGAATPDADLIRDLGAGGAAPCKEGANCTLMRGL